MLTLHFRLSWCPVLLNRVTPFPRPLAPLAPLDDEISGVLESPSKRRCLADDPNSSSAGPDSLGASAKSKLQQFWKSL